MTEAGTGTNSETEIMPSRIIKWVTGGLEAVWGIPILGGSMILGMVWIPLVVMLVLHIIGIVFAAKEDRNKSGHILGILASSLGWIPGVGMVLHILAAIFLMIEAGKNQ